MWAACRINVVALIIVIVVVGGRYIVLVSGNKHEISP